MSPVAARHGRGADGAYSIGVLYAGDDESLIVTLDLVSNLVPQRQTDEHGRGFDPKDHSHGFHVEVLDRLVLDRDLASGGIDVGNTTRR